MCVWCVPWTLYDRRHHGGKVQSAVGSESRPMRGFEIGETGHRAVELQFDRARWAVTLLADDHLGLAFHPFALGQPFREFLAIGFDGFTHLMIVLLTEYEEYDVGILFNRSGFAQIRQLRALVFA